ncbi:MAG TPA: CrcB family protein [Acidimicrobiales bacterium]|nr:CrcB family protein [Acidimicrobiales bacterium]
MTALVALGFVAAAAIGTLVRSLVGRRWNRPGRLPLGTLAVNVGGAFAVGLLAGWDAPEATIVAVGGLGAVTTFSTLAAELVALDRAGRRTTAVAYLMVTVALGVGAAGAGLALAA